MRPITWLLATDRRGAASIDRKFKMKNRLLHAGFVEAIPVIFDNADNGSFDSRVHVDTDNEVLFKFDEVSSAIPKMDVVSLDNEWFRRVAKSLAVLLEFENVAVNVIAIIQRYVTVDRFGSPDLGGNVDNKIASKRRVVRYRQHVGWQRNRAWDKWQTSQQRVVTVLMLGWRVVPIIRFLGLQINRSRDKWRRRIVVEVVSW